jgi:hypothetical protein
MQILGQDSVQTNTLAASGGAVMLIWDLRAGVKEAAASLATAGNVHKALRTL